MPGITVRPLTSADREWVRSVLTENWASPQIVTRGRVHQADLLPGFLAELNDRPAGLLTYQLKDGQCEVVSLNSFAESRGIGTALLDAAVETARQAGCRRAWLITTNDNLPAVRFYQKRDWHLVAVHRNALDVSRQLKPGIPQTGLDGIPLRDEIELGLSLEE